MMDALSDLSICLGQGAGMGSGDGHTLCWFFYDPAFILFKNGKNGLKGLS